MNADIENGKILNWQSFKKLKQQKQEITKFDCYDMNKFEKFFSNLYSDEHPTVSHAQKTRLINSADRMNHDSTPNQCLNEEITVTEINTAIKSLKTGKASSADMISNEIIKNLNGYHRLTLLNLFNACFNSGIYPWNSSIISPLHKKGNKSDPDNYRAVAVSSALGKLFSAILLNRLITYRDINCPDPPNQLGFTKKSQTYDYILTMNTIASKYKKARIPVYAVFVDFKKAFDSVCRQALFFKLAKNGITGKFYNILRNMYSNSFAYIKLSGRLSNRISIKKGTEQGHPLSPDLFKIFISDLTPVLDANRDDCPKLDDILISHLLWADDLIMLSLSQKTAQLQLNILAKFCKDWGIEVNRIKTQVVIFGKKFVNDISSIKFHLNDIPLKIVDSYCYLGIELHCSGELRTAQNCLKTKAMRAFLGLKRVVMRSKISFKAISTLFDSLIKPIILYGAPIWIPNSSAFKSIIKFINNTQAKSSNLLKQLSYSPQEKIHLSFLKWALGVHRKASNVGTWGETGRFPLIYQSVRLTLNYFKRQRLLKLNSFVSAALREQESLNLPWYKNLVEIMKLDEIYSLDHITAHRIIKGAFPNAATTNSAKITPPAEFIASTIPMSPLKSKMFRTPEVIKIVMENFKHHWELSKSTSPKLAFYHSCKEKFNREAYLDYCKGFSRRYSTAKIRISAHDFHIQTGRY